MAIIISCNNQKGGSGKTATSVNIAKGLSDDGYQVLLVDLDLQANASAKFCKDYERGKGIVEAYTGISDVSYVVRNTAFDNLKMITAKLEWVDCLEDMARKSHVEEWAEEAGDSLRAIHDLLELNENMYDVIILDNNPSYQTVLKNCIYASDLMIIPVNIDKNAIKGVNYMISFITKVTDSVDEEANCVPMVLITKKTGTKMASAITEEIRQRFPGHVFETTIWNQNKPAEKQTFTRNCFMIDDQKTRVGKDYRKLVDEIEKEILV